MTRKTKADLERELAELRVQLNSKPNHWPSLNTLVPVFVAAGCCLVILLVQWVSVAPGPTPIPPPEPPPKVLTIDQAVKSHFLRLRTGHRDVFNAAADAVNADKIKTDAELFSFIQPALVELRDRVSGDFDKAFDQSLPRNDDGAFAEHKPQVSEFLQKIARGW
ncbi:MAG: hypothetical protein KF752_11725 [Pirellulaceae bacterium]|nr:hypothetical protein [Pirellulaceae bacterium]